MYWFAKVFYIAGQLHEHTYAKLSPQFVYTPKIIGSNVWFKVGRCISGLFKNEGL